MLPVKLANKPVDATSTLTPADPAPSLAKPGEVHLRFDDVFEHAVIGMALIAPDTRGLRVNRALCEMMGYTEAEMLVSRVQDITHPDDFPEDVRLLGLLRSGQIDSYEREKRYIHRSGRLLWGHVSCSVVRGASGEPLYFVTQVQDISERKRSEQARLESEQRYRSLAALSSDWYWEQDEQFRFRHFSGDGHAGAWRPDQLASMGLCRWEMAGITLLNSSWEQHRATVHAHEPFREMEYVRQIGSEPPSYVSTSGEPVFDAHGVFKGYRGTARDITESRLAAQKLRDAQSMLALAAELGRLGAWTFERASRRLTLSPEACAIFDQPAGSAMTAEEIVNCCVANDRDRVATAIRACIGTGTPVDIEAAVVTARGHNIWVRMICEAQWDAAGRVVSLHGAVQDITDSRRAAEQTREMAEKLTTTLESLTDAFMTLDRNWCFTYVNSKAEYVLRRSRGELLGRDVWEAFPELAATSFSVHYRRAMEENVTVQFEEFYPAFNVWVQVRAYPSAQGLAVYMRNVTDKVQAQQEVLRLNVELEERVRQRTAQLELANKDLEDFAYSIAHDLRAPLGSIDGFSKALLEGARNVLSGKHQHYLERISAGVRQMSSLTDGLLVLAGLARTRMRPQSVDLALLARDALAVWHEREPQRAVKFGVAPSLPAFGDARLLRQVLDQLISNAWKAADESPCIEIDVGAQTAADGTLTYFVRDNGVGFDPTQTTRLFKAFRSVHATARYEGMGIGLATVHKIVTRHGGRVWAESTPGQGATFYFTLDGA